MHSSILASVSKFHALHAAYSGYLLQRQRRQIATIRRSYNTQGVELVEAEDAWFRPTTRQTVCHIIGSGWSLNESYTQALRDDAYVVGFNFAGLIELPYSAYFVEFAGPEIQELSQRQKALLDRRIRPITRNIYFKGLTLPRNDPAMALELFGAICRFTQDLILPCLGPANLKATCRELLKQDKTYIRQYMSTTLTLIAIALHSGFKKIVLHGVDFGGSYFYEHPKFHSLEDLLPPSKGIYYVKNSSKSTPHVTNLAGVGVEASLHHITQLLPEGVALYAGCEASPLSAILPVFK